MDSAAASTVRWKAALAPRAPCLFGKKRSPGPTARTGQWKVAAASVHHASRRQPPVLPKPAVLPSFFEQLSLKSARFKRVPTVTSSELDTSVSNSLDHHQQKVLSGLARPTGPPPFPRRVAVWRLIHPLPRRGVGLLRLANLPLERPYGLASRMENSGCLA